MRQTREAGLIREPRWLDAGRRGPADASRWARAVMEIGLLVTGIDQAFTGDLPFCPAAET